MFTKRPNKYGAVKTLCTLNHPHPSKLEASVCQLLQLRENCGDIRNLKWQHSVLLDYGIRWKVDFSFEQSPDWIQSFAEAKGAEDRGYKLKVRMWAGGAGVGPLELWKGDARRPVLVKTIIPKAGRTESGRNLRES